MRPRISAVINTLNEEKNLPYALGSVHPWVDEIIVVDMYSDDKTVDIAREFGAKVFFHERLGFADPARAFALEQATGDWILMLDADEMIPYSLSRELIALASSDVGDVAQIHRMSYWFGSPLMHTNTGPHQDRTYRFFRRGHILATPAIHNFFHPLPGSRVFELKYKPGLAIVHFAYVDSQDFIEKLDRYTGIEARQAWERGEEISLLKIFFKVGKELGLRYVKGGALLDGWRGAYVTLLYIFYVIVSAGKLYELAALGGGQKIESTYRQEAESFLKDYTTSAASVSEPASGSFLNHGY